MGNNMDKTRFAEILKLNDRYNMYAVDTDPKIVKINKTTAQFEQDKGGSTLDHVTAAAHTLHDMFPDLEMRSFFVSFWAGSIFLYMLPILTFKAQPEDYIPICWNLFSSNNRGKKGGLPTGVFSCFYSSEQIISLEIFHIQSNPINSDAHLHAAQCITYEFNALDKAIWGMSDMQTLNWMKTQKSLGYLPPVNLQIGAPPRNKSYRRANEIDKIFRYNKYDPTARAMEILEGDKTSDDVDSYNREILEVQNSSRQMNGAQAAKL
jgi:hypothetical protein